MKRLKSGFTLAEVLITLAIIGVVAAIVMPSVMSNYQYKSVGVKLAKFMSTVEAAARPFVVNDANFSTESGSTTDAAGVVTPNSTKTNATDFINEAFLFKTFEPQTFGEGDSEVKVLSYPDLSKSKFSSYSSTQNKTAAAPVAVLKDGTAIQVFLDDTQYDGDHKQIVNPSKYGNVVFRIEFDPRVQGLPTTAQKRFNFSVTELGYIFPHDKDTCTWYLFNNDYSTKAKDFESGACKVSATSGS